MKFLVLLLLLVGSPDDTATWLKQLDSDDASKRREAWRELRSDSGVRRKLTARLKSIRDRYLRKAKTVRQSAVKAHNPKPDANSVAAARKQALELLRSGNTKAMRPVVEKLWKALYVDTDKADLDPEVKGVRERVLECVERLDALGVKSRKDHRAELLVTFQKVDEDAIIKGMPPADQAIMKANRAAGKQLPLPEYRVILWTNQYRVLMGKNALRINLKLCGAAREHSRDMKQHNFFGHNSPLPGKRTCVDRAKRHGTTCNSENLAKDATVEEACWGWFGSLPHHRGMLGPWKQIGVGHHESYWTENF